MDVVVFVYFGDGVSSQGDVSELLIFVVSYQILQVFFLQNNYWVILVFVEWQFCMLLYLWGIGFGILSVQIDGNDVLVSYVVILQVLCDVCSGGGF